ncbi:MAG: ribonucleotide-diphosphate reductase subunit beta, partial [Candidatus Nanopusillus acidilobi]
GFVTPLAFGRRGVLKNVAALVRWILKDETRHLAFGIYLLNRALSTNFDDREQALSLLCSENGLQHTELLKDKNKNDKYATIYYKDKFRALMEEAVDIETEYARVAMPEKIIGLSFETYTSYVRYLADRRMRSLGFDAIYGQKNPMKWLTTQTDLPDLTNFFEAKVDY